MPPTFLRSFQVTHGVIGGESSPEGEEHLYVTPQELEALYQVCVDETDIRAAMAIANAYLGRSSLWPVEIDSNELSVPSGRLEVRLPVTPVISITDAAGKFGPGRRDRQGWNSYYNHGLASYLVLLGAGPQWTPIDVNTLQVEPATGIVWIPASFMFASYTSVRFRFVAGFLTMPDRVKLAIADIIQNLHTRQISSRMRYAVGKVSAAYSGETFVSQQAAALLEPFRVQSLY